VLRRRKQAPEEDQARGASLDRAAKAQVRRLRSLSELTAPLALGYLERIGRATPDLTTEVGVLITTTGYAAHLAVEADGKPWGVTEMPVIGSLPPTPTGDLTLRLIKASRRSFYALRAVDGPTWESFVSRRTAATDPPLQRGLVEGLLQFGWLLRQTDIHYGLEPETD
jgi:hypothetical protein